MAAVLPRQPRRPVLLRADSCPSPRPPPAQYIAQSPSAPKWPPYVDNGTWQGAPAYNALGSDFGSPSSHLPGFGVSTGPIMASAPGACGIPWPLEPGGFHPNLVAGWADMSSAGIQPVWSGRVNNSFTFGFPQSSDNGSIPLPYAVVTMAAPFLMAPPAATVFSRPSMPLGDARLNATAPKPNYGQTVSPSADPQGCLTYQTPPAIHHPAVRSSIISDLKPSAHRKSSAAQNTRTWKISSTKVKRNAGKVVGSEQVWMPDVRERRTQTEEEKQRRAINREQGACPHHKKGHGRVSYPY